MKLFKKFLAVLMAAVMCIGCIPITAAAATLPSPDYKITGRYLENGRTYAVTLSNIPLKVDDACRTMANFDRFTFSINISYSHDDKTEMLMYNSYFCPTYYLGTKDEKFSLYTTGYGSYDIDGKFTKVSSDYVSYTFYITDPSDIEKIKKWKDEVWVWIEGGYDYHYPFSDGKTSGNVRCYDISMEQTSFCSYTPYTLTGKYVKDGSYEVTLSNINENMIEVCLDEMKTRSGKNAIQLCIKDKNTNTALEYTENYKNGAKTGSSAAVKSNDTVVSSIKGVRKTAPDTITFRITNQDDIKLVQSISSPEISMALLFNTADTAHISDNTYYYCYNDGTLSLDKTTTDISMEQGAFKPDISTLKFNKLPSYAYNGKVRTPEVVIKDGSRILVKGTDYTVAYSNNKNVGIASVTIKGIGDYKGTVTKTFKITPTKSTLKITKQTDEKISFKWSQSKGVEKYYIYMSVDGGKYKKVATIGGAKTSVTIKGFDFDEGKYSFKIRAVAFDGDTPCYSGYSNVVTEKA